MVDAPPITRIGVKANFFDVEIKGAPDTGGFETGPFTIGDIKIPPEMGLFQKCIGVQWGVKEQFLLVGGHTVAHQFTTDDGNFPFNIFTCTSGASKDGQDWGSGRSGFSVGGNGGGDGTNGGSVFECGIRGQKVFCAGGFTVEISGETGEPGVFETDAVPFIAFSDDGVSWDIEALPTLNPELDSITTAVTYNPNTGVFTAYVTGEVSLGNTQTVPYSFSEPNFKAPNSDTNDKPLRIVNTGVADSFSLPSGDFVSCCLDGQVVKFKIDGQDATMKLTGSETQLLIDTGKTSITTAPPDTSLIISAAAKSDGSAIVAVVMDNNSGGGVDNPIQEPHVYVSTDQGGSWIETFPAATAGNENNQESFGSISFS